MSKPTYDNFAKNEVVKLQRFRAGGTPLALDLAKIQQTGYQLVRRFGTNVEYFKNEIDRISGGNLFYSERMGEVCHQYQTELISDNFSEQIRCGGFHTDFMFQPHPPAYIALLCLQPDPKYPLYGRNQIVSLSKFLARAEQAFGLTVKELSQRKLRYDFGVKGHFYKSIISKLDTSVKGSGAEFRNDCMFHFHQLLTDAPAPCDLDRAGYLSQLHAIMIDVSDDLCLNQGDLLIISNHYALHRRGECSVAFDSINGIWRRRRMASIRFDL